MSHTLNVYIIAQSLSRSQQCLDDWRKEARERQNQQQKRTIGVHISSQKMLYPTAAEKAPFATDQQAETEERHGELSQSRLTLLAMEGQREAMSYSHRQGSTVSTTNSLR